MTIRLVCENETGYDPTSGAFTYCDHTFTCDDTLLAKITKCPKCQNSIRVGSSRRHVWLETGQPVADTAAVSHQAIAEATKGRVPSPLDGAPAEPIKKRRANKTKVAICPSCGTAVTQEQVRCPACRAELARPKGIGSRSLKINRPVGFHRWILKTVLAGVSPTVVAWVLHLSILSLGLAIIALAFVSFTPQSGTVWTGVVGFCWLLYLYIYFSCYRSCTDLAFSLRWWQQLFWYQILSSARAKNWVSDPTDPRPRQVLDLRDQRINDELLLQHEGITTCQVLDLENCPISNDGAQTIHFLKDLRCLIIRGTAITSDERARIQLSLPLCWIWY